MLQRVLHPRLRSLTALLAALCLCVPACSQDDGNEKGGQTDKDTSTGIDFGDGGTSVDTDATAADVIVPPDSTSDVIAPDAGTNCPGGAGCYCIQNSECDNSLCVDALDGKHCAITCVETCPGSYVCSQITSGGGDVMSICVPADGHLCDPCTDSADCESLGLKDSRCVSYGGDGNFCGIACATDAHCPAGHGCRDVTTVEGGPTKQCVRLDQTDPTELGQCSCAKAAIEKKLTTTCTASVTLPDGATAACLGSRSCLAAGLGPCEAPAPSGETCDGLDNDCNGTTDDGTCDDSNPCTVDACQPADGKCSHGNLAGGPCDADGTVCTADDTCKGGSCVAGNALDCGDNNVCTDDACDAVAGCVHLPNKESCDADDDACTVGDACADGGCSKGAVKDCNDANGCTGDSCDTKTGGCGHKVLVGQACDDGDACTAGDACDGPQGGSCGAGKLADCDDKNPCTVDTCAPATGKCGHAPTEGKPCDDGDACTSAEKCEQGGGCGGGQAKDCDDKNTCTIDNCDSKTGLCAHTSNAGNGCDDGNACTDADVCATGAGGEVCIGGKPKVCADGNPCTNDACDKAKGCLFTASVGKGVPCYEGPAQTSGVGGCKPGAMTCDDKAQLGTCKGQVVPAKAEACDGIDDDCNGKTDEGCKPVDLDWRYAPGVVAGKSGGVTVEARMQTGPVGDGDGGKHAVQWSLLDLWLSWGK